MSTDYHTKESYEIELKSPMGWITIKAELTLTSPNEFTGEAKLMGKSVPLTNCHKNGTHYEFQAAPRLPFGVVEVSVSADVQEDGSVSGIADAPRHRPMEIRGKRTAAITAAEAGAQERAD